MSLNLSPELMAQLWRVSPAAMATHLTKGEPQPWYPAEHLQLLSKWICAAVAGRTPRIVVNMPPRHGKSLLVSMWTPLWFLENYPHLNVINCGYGNDFAREWGRKTKDLVAQHQDKIHFTLAADSKAADRWNTKQGGGMKTAGIGGGITGRGAHCLPAGSLVTTDHGQVDIAELVAMAPDARPRVLSVNHTTGCTVWSRIIATKVSSATTLIEVTTRHGRIIRSTGRHLFHTAKRGYRQARLLKRDELTAIDAKREMSALQRTEGTEYCLPEVLRRHTQGHRSARMHALQGRIQKTPVPASESITTWPHGHVLFAEMQQGAPRGQELRPVHSVREACQEWPHVLRSSMSQSRTPGTADHRMPHVPRGVYSAQRTTGVLQPSLRQQGPFGAHDWQGEFSFQDRNQLCEVVSRNATAHIRAGSGPLCSMPDSDGSLEGGRWGENKPRCAPRERSSFEQSSREPVNALCDVPRGTPQVVSDSVSMVRRLHSKPIAVYDIQVEGTSNFFANEILVHNCLLIDDPIKDDQEASSLLERNRLWEWWRGTATTRIEPGGCVILCMTRWHEDDLAGRLIKESEQAAHRASNFTPCETGLSADTCLCDGCIARREAKDSRWDVLNLPAIAEEGDILKRPVGRALWPARFDVRALEAKMRSVGPENWAAQFQGHPANLVANGNVYKSFGQERNVRPLAFDPRRPLVWSLDFNVDPMCSTICQWHEQTTLYTYLTNDRQKSISVLQELSLPNSSTLEACEEFVNRTEAYRHLMQGRPLHVRIYGDRSGQSRKTVGDTDYVAIKDFFRVHPEYSITVHLSKANPPVKDRVNAVNAMLCNALGEVRCYIDPACKELIADFRQIQWKRDSSGNTTGQVDKSDMHRTHVSDAFGYFVQKEFGLQNKSGAMPGIAQ